MTSSAVRTELGSRQRLRFRVSGAVQGVGFRPFVYRLATDLGLSGWVNNSSAGVTIEVQGDRVALHTFQGELVSAAPRAAVIQMVRSERVPPETESEFRVVASDASESKTALVLPDLATCDDCLADIRDRENRRYRYPFTNCTNCGPRFTIVEDLPYDRENTTMRGFPMCPACLAEYQDPANRRFHAQPNACPDCGPRLFTPGDDLEGDAALRMVEDALRGGAIAAVKGLGGFHLMVDARNQDAVLRLRRRKVREQKPMAVMVPSLEVAESMCLVSPLERGLLRSVAAPIVLLERRYDDARLAPAVAPGNPYLGVMLPSTPLHHLLLADLGFPLVATSGNLSDEPICTDNDDALQRLGGIADVFLFHDRPIARHADDSVVREAAGSPLLLRRARGYAPAPIPLRESGPRILASGGHMKSTIALSVGSNAVVSQHIGDLDTAEAAAVFGRLVSGLERIYDFAPQLIACDAHPDYWSTSWARGQGVPVTPVQHHLAHALSCAGEHALTGEVLGIVWDGTGYGEDGSIWGGEFLRIHGNTWERFGHLRYFPLPGGDRAAREPRRAALGLLYEMEGASCSAHPSLASRFQSHELAPLVRAVDRGVNCPRTSSVGRLFDAVSSLCDLIQVSGFEAQAAMAVEFAAQASDPATPYEFGVAERESLVLDWEPAVRAIMHDLAAGKPVAYVAGKFHDTLAAMAVSAALAAGKPPVVLAGGCFQNRVLLERTVAALRSAGIDVYWNRLLPPNDGSVAVGQLIGALRHMERIS